MSFHTRNFGAIRCKARIRQSSQKFRGGGGGRVRHYRDHPRAPTSPSPKPSTNPQPDARVERAFDRLPGFAQRYVGALRAAPFSHVSAFLILHELTAIVPLFGLAGLFHYADWLPPGFAEAKWMKEGTRRFGNFLRKKGWISEEQKLEAGEVVEKEAIREREEGAQSRGKGWFGFRKQTAEGEHQEADTKPGLLKRTVGKITWGAGESGVRLVLEFATAYTIVKMLIIPRVIFSVWGTPWFARMVVEPVSRRTIGPVWNRLKRLFGGGGKHPTKDIDRSTR